MPIFMNYEGIRGSATGKYAGWIPLRGCELGAESGKVIRRDVISVRKEPDASTPHLMEKFRFNNTAKVKIDFVEKEITTPFLSLELEGTIIIGFRLTGSSTGSSFEELFELSFERIRHSLGPTASVKGAKAAKKKLMWKWKVETGKK